MKLALALLPAVFASVTSAACIDVMEPMGEVTQETVCPVDECGGNASIAGYLRIGEAHIGDTTADHKFNTWNVKYSRFLGPHGVTGYQLQVQNGQFVASDGTSVLTGPALKGTTLRYEDISGDFAAIEIVAVDKVESWTVEKYDIERYKLGIRYSSGEVTPVCEEAESIDDDDAWAVLLSGERYDWPGKSVIASGAQGRDWFNIACVGNGLYKTKLMGYDPEPPTASPYTTTADERQAALKMITADYCGTGTSFTASGTALQWRNADNWSYNSVGSGAALEALWDADGALCLNEPRLGQDAAAAIAAECAIANKVLPPCHTPGVGTTGVWQSRLPTAP